VRLFFLSFLKKKIVYQDRLRTNMRTTEKPYPFFTTDDDSLSSTAGCEGLRLHGFGDSDFVDGRYYLYNNGRLRCGMVNCQVYTTAVNPGDGGLVLVPGRYVRMTFVCIASSACQDVSTCGSLTLLFSRSICAVL
jgi:hypothetical protein